MCVYVCFSCSSRMNRLTGGVESSSPLFSFPAKVTHCKCGDSVERSQPTAQPQAPATVTYVVKMTLSLPMSKADFTPGKQTLFKKSIAAGALHVNVCCLCVPIVLCSQACEHILKMRFLLAAAGPGVSETDVTIKIEINTGVYLPSRQACQVALLEFGLYMVCICM